MIILGRIKKYLIFIVIVSFVILSILYCINKFVDDISRGYIVNLKTAPYSDAILVLGAFVHENKFPSYVLQDRLDYGYELYRNKRAPKILVSGDHGTVSYDEVNVMKDYLLKKGVPPEDIFLDHAGFNTYDSMYRAKNIFGIKKLLISTQEFHINRSVYIARRIGLEAYGYPSKNKEIYKMRYLEVREFFAKIKAFFDVEIFKRKSRFLGEEIPITDDGRVTDDLFR